MRKRFAYLKIRNKLIIIFALTVVVSFSFTLIVQQYAFSFYDEQIYEKSSQVLNLSSTVMENELQRIAEVSFDIIADEQIQGWLKKIKESESDYDRLLLRQYVLDRLFSYSSSEPYIYSIHIIDARKYEHAAGNSKQMGQGKLRRIIKQTNELDGESMWIYPDEYDSALITAREIRNYSGTNFDLAHLGTVIIRINLDRLVKDHAAKDGELFVMSGEEFIFPSQSESAAHIVNPASNRKGYYTGSYRGERFFVSYSRSPVTGWMYYNITPYNHIFDGIQFIKNLVVFVFVGILIMAIAWSIRFSIRLTKPLDRLMQRMKLAEKGNFEEANVLSTDDAKFVMDEVGLLQRTFRNMIYRIQMLIKENFEKQLMIKDTQFRALQAQINPHFLYNTLDSINWMAKVNRQPNISEMVESLGMLLRNSMNLKQSIISLEEELNIVRSYVTIQQFRYEERLDFRIHVEDRFLKSKVPKLCLQPLVENAIHYTVEQSIGTSRISIGAGQNENGFWLAVEDDGQGMPPDVMNKLRKEELQGRGQGIGLLNIDERIQIAFGESYGVHVEEDRLPGQGARVILTLPCEEGS